MDKGISAHVLWSLSMKKNQSHSSFNSWGQDSLSFIYIVSFIEMVRPIGRFKL